MGYKYLGIPQLDQTLNAKMKAKIGEEYIRRVKKLFRFKLNGGNLVLEINSWAVAVVRCGVWGRSHGGDQRPGSEDTE